MTEPLPIAYLTSAYARASDSFIRVEVEALRALGHEVETFSIRRPPESEAVSEEVRAERSRTQYILVRENASRLALDLVRAGLRSPARLAGSLALALRCSSVGLKSRAWALAYLAEACVLARELRARNVGHLHNHMGEGSATVAMLASHLTRTPYSLTIHGPGEFDHPASLALDEKTARAAFVVAVSDFGKSQLLRWVRREDWDKVKVVHCGVYPAFLEAEPTPVPSAPRLVCVGRLAAEKGLMVLVEAAGELMREETRFEIAVIGDGPMRAVLERRIQELGLGESVRLLGWRSGNEVREEVRNARALVLPSFAENLPVAIMEALALSRPVITTYYGGIPELVRDGENGWLVPASSIEGLTRAMRQALTASPEELARMGRAGASLVRLRHDPATEAAKLSSLIMASQEPSAAANA